MFFVYVIKSEKDGKIYVGMSSDVELRLKQHNAGITRSTKGYRPWVLIFTERVKTREDAREREIYLKSGVGKEFLKSLVP